MYQIEINVRYMKKETKWRSDSIMKRTAILGLLIGIFGCSAGFGLIAGAKEIAPGDAIPAVETFSMEGLPVTLQPPEGKTQYILFWDLEQAESVEAVKAAIVLYNRFHEKGLDALCVCINKSEENINAFSDRWLVPFPIVMDSQNDPKIAAQLNVSQTPFSLLIDAQGKVLAVNLKGDDAHAKIAEILKVSLADLPMPPAPVARQKSQNFNSIPGQNDGVLLKTVNVVIEESFVGSPEERLEAKDCVANLRKINLALTRYRLDHDGELPEWLSDLYPKYISDKAIFIDPKFPEPPTDYQDFADPKIPCSFLYEFNPTNKAHKMDQLQQYGDKVPVVRILKYGRPINLSYGGEIYFSKELFWENDFQLPRSLDDRDAQIRQKLRRLAVAIDDYKKDRGEVPNELKDLIPKYLPSENDISFSEVTIYEFSPNQPNNQEPKLGANFREWKTKQREEFGDAVPIVRIFNVLQNGKAINLSYGGEIWESDAVWEDNLRGTKKSLLERSRIELAYQTAPEEIGAKLAERNWSTTPIQEAVKIEKPEQIFPVRGQWFIYDKNIQQNLPMVQNAIAVFEPFVRRGEIHLKARVENGQEGVRILFGFTSPNHYLVWNLGGWGNTASSVEKRTSLSDEDYELLCDKKDFQFKYGEWHEIRLSIDADAKTALGYIDGQEILSLKTEENLEGRLGLGTWLTAAEFENVEIEGK